MVRGCIRIQKGGIGERGVWLLGLNECIMIEKMYSSVERVCINCAHRRGE